MLKSVSDFIKLDMRAYLQCKNKKPLLLQVEDVCRLAALHRYLPYHYFVLGLYDKNVNDVVINYLPAKIMAKYLMHLNKPNSLTYVNNKLIFRQLLEAEGIPVIREILRIDKEGSAIDPDGIALSFNEAVSALRAHGGEIFVKPIAGTYGRGAFVATPEDFEHVLREARDVLIQPRLKQHSVLHNLYPNSVNTVRIDTLYTENGWVHNAAVLRVGVGGAVVDNRGAGGIVVGLDLETGRLRSHGRQQPKSSTEWHDRHPDTGIPFSGIVVPHWNAVLETVRRGAEVLLPRGLVALGWDVALLPDGVVLVEANCNWGSVAMQIGWGGLAETEVGRRARQHHGLCVATGTAPLRHHR